MAEFAALPLFTDAYLADTRHLSAAQHGAYLLLLMMAWRSPDCAVPDDDEKLARWVSMDRRTWTKNKPAVMAFWRLDAGFWRQGRLSDERKYVEHKRNKNSSAGKASALKRLNRGSTFAEPEANKNSTPSPSPSPSPSEDIETTNVVSLVPAASGDEPTPKGSASKPKNGTRLPVGWLPTPDDCGVGYERGLTEDEIRYEHKKFTDYWLGVAGQRGRKIDWGATFRNWLRKSADDKRNRSI